MEADLEQLHFERYVDTEPERIGPGAGISQQRNEFPPLQAVPHVHRSVSPGYLEQRRPGGVRHQQMVFRGSEILIEVRRERGERRAHRLWMKTQRQRDVRGAESSRQHTE